MEVSIRNESLTVYISCLFSALTPGHGGENFFIANIMGPFYFATKENRWLDQITPYLPKWFSPALSSGGGYDAAGHAVVEGWYLGNGGAIPWGAWFLPLLAWSSLILASYAMLACLSVMLRAQWAEREALNFPLLRPADGDDARREQQRRRDAVSAQSGDVDWLWAWRRSSRF